MSNETAVEMFVGGLVLDPNTQAPVVVLKDESGKLCLPIWIGIAEATSIATAIKQVAMERPLTHDLMYDVFTQIGIKIQRVVITELKESTYYAELVLMFGDKALIIDARPSDAIALALRASASIFVAQSVLEQAAAKAREAAQENNFLEFVAEDQEGAEMEHSGDDIGEYPGGDLTAVDKEKWQKILEDLDPDDFKYKV